MEKATTRAWTSRARDPALPLTDDELLDKYRDCARSQLGGDDMERSVRLVLEIDRETNIETLMATLGSPWGKTQE